jgi:hypothetical protein
MENENGVDKSTNLINQSDLNLQQFNYIAPNNLLDLQNNQFNSDQNLQNNSTFPIQSPENLDQAAMGERSNDKSEESDEKKNQKILKRRSKSEVEGRTHECKLCNKSYLSYPALYTHYKLKHNTNNSSGRGRGRPKKEQNESEIEKSRYNPTNLTFFSKGERTGKTEPSEINDCIDIVFNELYSDEYKKRNESREMKYYESVNEHPFLNKFKNDIHDTNKNVVKEHEIADIVLIDYLNKMSVFCNKEYYIKLIKFVTLFREHVNIFNSKADKNKYGEKEYTSIKDAEDVPDCSNEFITDFLHPETTEGNEAEFGFSKDESIDLTQNLCYWMYENNFTCSKLSLINNEK